MKIDSDKTKEWWLRFDPDDLVDAESLIDFVMFHKVQSSSEYSSYDKFVLLTAWEKVQKTLWGEDDD